MTQELTDEVGDCHAKIDRFLRNSLHDDDYAEYSECLEVIVAALALQSERHAEELLAYQVTADNLMQDRDLWAARCASEVAKVDNLDQRLKRDAKRRDEELLAYEVTVGNLRTQREQAQPERKPERDRAEEMRAEFHEEMRRDAFGDRA